MTTPATATIPTRNQMESNFLSRFKELQPLIRSVAWNWSRNCPTEKDDLLQEMALHLWRLLQHRPDAPREYIVTALRRVPLGYGARGSSVDRPSPKRRPYQWHIESLESLIGEYGNESQLHRGKLHSPVESKVIASLMQDELLESLPHRQAAFLRLRLQGYSREEVGEELGLNRSQLSGLTDRIRTKARTLWDGDGPAYATTSEVAKELRLPLNTVNRYCHQGRLYGARFERGRWLVPRPIKLLF